MFLLPKLFGIESSGKFYKFLPLMCFLSLLWWVFSIFDYVLTVRKCDWCKIKLRIYWIWDGSGGTLVNIALILHSSFWMKSCIFTYICLILLKLQAYYNSSSFERQSVYFFFVDFWILYPTSPLPCIIVLTSSMC